MSEKTLRKYVGQLIQGHVSQVESGATAAGIPDTSYCGTGIEGWIELKYATPSKHWELRKTQYAWMRDRLKEMSPRIFILWRYEDGNEKRHGIIHIKQSNLKSVFLDTSLEHWQKHSMYRWGNSIASHQLNHILVGDFL